MMKCFVDTNVLVYAKDSRCPSKQKAANEWIEALIGAGRLVLSAQSLREFYAVRLKIDHTPSGTKFARQDASDLAAFIPDTLRDDRLTEAWALEDRHRLNFYDSLLIASALAARCTFFLSEDLSSGQKIGALTIVNPFTTTPDAILGA